MGVAPGLRNSEHSEEIKRWPKPAGDVGNQEARAARNDVAEIAAVDAGLPEEESEDGAEGGGAAGREDLRAHAAHPAEVCGGETKRGEEVDGGTEFRERRRDDRWVVFDEGE